MAEASVSLSSEVWLIPCSLCVVYCTCDLWIHTDYNLKQGLCLSLVGRHVSVDAPFKEFSIYLYSIGPLHCCSEGVREVLWSELRQVWEPVFHFSVQAAELSSLGKIKCWESELISVVYFFSRWEIFDPLYFLSPRENNTLLNQKFVNSQCLFNPALSGLVT